MSEMTNTAPFTTKAQINGAPECQICGGRSFVELDGERYDCLKCNYGAETIRRYAGNPRYQKRFGRILG